jgi:hypothetical protein
MNSLGSDESLVILFGLVCFLYLKKGVVTSVCYLYHIENTHELKGTIHIKYSAEYLGHDKLICC